MLMEECQYGIPLLLSSQESDYSLYSHQNYYYLQMQPLQYQSHYFHCYHSRTVPAVLKYPLY